MDKQLKSEQASIDRAQAELDERQARIRLLENLTAEEKTAIEKVFREESASKEREVCPSCGREFLRSGVKRHIRATHPDDTERLQGIIDQRRS